MLMQAIPWYQHPITSLDLPHPYFPFFPLAAPANTGVSLPLQLMKATVLAESYNISFSIVTSPAMSTDIDQVGVALFPSY